MDETQVKDVYLAVNNLLEDTYKFLSGDTFQSFSPDDKQIASKLILRTKKQLEDMPKLMPKATENEEYVDMTKKYSTMDSTDCRLGNPKNKSNESSNDSRAKGLKTDCPYTDLRADLASQGAKSGHLWIRKRLFLKQKLFVSLHNNWLLLYTNNNEAKPFHSFNLRHCKACELEKNSRSFVLTHFNNGDKKNYMFMTKVPDTAAEWVNKINLSHLNDQQDSIRDQEYDIIEPKPSIEENIYNEPEMICPRVQENTTEADSNSKPPLPPERGLIPPPPMWRNSRTSLVSYNEVEDEENTDDKSQEVKIENDNIFESINFEDTILNLTKTDKEDVVKISKYSSNNLTSFCPFSKLKTFKEIEENDTFEERRSKVKDSISRTFNQHNNKEK